MTCNCGGNVEFTVVEDMNSKIFLLECQCAECGRMSHGFGITIEQALSSAKTDWARRRRKKSVRNKRQ